MNSFVCSNCKKEVATSGNIGTHQRNHCPFCLYSKHVDEIPGDRKATCHGLMKPIGLTFKQEGEGKVGELMLIHRCEKCGKISINRLAGDDLTDNVMQAYEHSKNLSEQAKIQLAQQDIYLVSEKDEEELNRQLFGN